MNYTYMLLCKDGSYYTGWTNDIKKRLQMHRSGQGAKYTKGRGPLTLIHLEVFDTQSEAMRREAYIKRLNRAEKEDLVKDESWKQQLKEWNLEELQIADKAFD